MDYLKTILLDIFLISLMGCQRQPEILFEDINIGDNLETCLAKGVVQYAFHNNFHDNDYYTLELANDNIASSYFKDNIVTFDEDKIVKSIYFDYIKRDREANSADEVFTSMTQYFCQKYKEMKTEEVTESKCEDGIESRFFATKNIWETNKIRIELMFYTKRTSGVNYDPAFDLTIGLYPNVSLEIVSK